MTGVKGELDGRLLKELGCIQRLMFSDLFLLYSSDHYIEYTSLSYKMPHPMTQSPVTADPYIPVLTTYLLCTFLHI